MDDVLYTEVTPIFLEAAQRFAQHNKAICDNLVYSKVITSPIEYRMLAALIAAPTGYLWEFEGQIGVGWDWPPSHIQEMPVVVIIPQAQAGPYRLDFGVSVRLLGGVHKFAIECDGHDFHEKTKEQAAHDKKRDRWLATNGWVILRYAGSEIYRSAEKCADEFYSHICSLIQKDGTYV